MIRLLTPLLAALFVLLAFYLGTVFGAWLVASEAKRSARRPKLCTLAEPSPVETLDEELW